MHLLMEERVKTHEEGNPKQQLLIIEARWQREWDANGSKGQ